MKKTLVLLMLFVLGLALCPGAAVFAEDVPEEEAPELFDRTAAVMTFDIGTVNLDEEPQPEPAPEPAE